MIRKLVTEFLVGEAGGLLLSTLFTTLFLGGGLFTLFFLPFLVGVEAPLGWIGDKECGSVGGGTAAIEIFEGAELITGVKGIY